MKAVMLAAGKGVRLGNSDSELLPKVLLRFGGKTLLERHVEILRCLGVNELVIGVGYHAEEIAQEIANLQAGDFVRTVFNPEFHLGNIVTLWSMRAELRYGGPVILMDADVLYEEQLFGRLLASRHPNCLLLDRDFTLDDEPVKLCVRDGEIVEIRKWVNTDFDFCGESVGFFKIAPATAERLVAQTGLYLQQGKQEEPYEEAIRDLLLTSPAGTFAFEDVTGLPWIEIDFQADIERANREILPRILKAEHGREASLNNGEWGSGAELVT